MENLVLTKKDMNIKDRLYWGAGGGQQEVRGEKRARKGEYGSALCPCIKRS
jgi:hypothetical protein